MRNDEKLVTIAEFENGFDAELAKVALENADINSVILGEEIGSIKPYSSTAFNVELQVFESDIERAKQILSEMEPLEEEQDVEGDEGGQ